MRSAFTALGAAAVSRRTATCYAKVSPTIFMVTILDHLSGRQPVTPHDPTSTSTRPYIGCGAISSHCTYTVTFSATLSSLLDASLSLNWPPRFNRARPPQFLVTTHYSCHCAPRHSLAAAEHGPSIRFDQRDKSSVLVHFRFTNAASARDRVSAASSTLPHPQRTHRDSSHCAATTSIRFRQPTPITTLLSRSKRSHCIMTSRFMDDSPVRILH
jgi:hypothetical protein